MTQKADILPTEIPVGLDAKSPPRGRKFANRAAKIAIGVVALAPPAIFFYGLTHGGPEEVCHEGTFVDHNITGNQEYIDCRAVNPHARTMMQLGLFVTAGEAAVGNAALLLLARSEGNQPL